MPFRSPRPAGRKRWLRRTAMISAGVLVLIAAVAGGAYAYLSYRLGQVHKVHVSHLAETPVSSPFNVLVVGSDSRAVAGNNNRSFGSTAQVPGQRSDVIKIFHFDPAARRVSELDVPRDLVLPIAGGAPNRINTAFSNGPDTLVATIENDLHIQIAHYVLVTFEGFQGVVNALNGVKLDFPVPVYDTFTGLRITRSGCQLLNGSQALAVARSRHLHYYAHGSWHYDGSSDLGRIVRQDAFLRAVIKRAAGHGLGNPLTANAFLGSVVHQLTIDDRWSVSDLVQLAYTYRNFRPDQLVSYTLPTVPVTGYRSLGDVLLPVQGKDQHVIAAWSASPGTGTPSAGTTSARTPKSSTSPTTAAPSAAPSASPPTHAGAPAKSRSSLPFYDPRPC